MSNLDNYYRVGVITLSDKGSVGQREDISGLVICEMVEAEGYRVDYINILPDDKEKLEWQLKRLCDENKVDLILTTGGTGLGGRDVTPDATLAVAHKVVPGIAEAMRYASLQITKRAMLSRAVSVIRHRTLIVNLPGSPKAVRETLEFILPELRHGLDILTGAARECARTE